MKRLFVVTTLLLLFADVSTLSALPRKKKKKAKTTQAVAKQEGEKKEQASEPREEEHETRKERRARRRREKRERKEKARQEREQRKNKAAPAKETKVIPKQAEPSTLRRWTDIELKHTEKKARYRVDVLARLYLDELVKNGNAVKELPEKAINGLSFYKGLQIAADSLKNAGFLLEIFVHDVASIDESVNNLVFNSLLDSTDLIISSVPPKEAAVVAAWAKAKQVNFVSVVSLEGSGITDNPYCTSLIPTANAYPDWILEEFSEKNFKRKSVLLYPLSEMGNPAISTIMDWPARKTMFATRTYINMPKKDTMLRILDTGTVNHIVAPLMSASSGEALLKWINAELDNYKVVVYGTSEWKDKVNLKRINPNVSVVLPQPWAYKGDMPGAKYVSTTFRRQYGGQINDYVYCGFETMFWYAHLLKKYGTIFNKHYSDNEMAPFTKFDVKPRWDGAGNLLWLENRHYVETIYLSAER